MTTHDITHFQPGRAGGGIARRNDRALARQLVGLDRSRTYGLARIEASAQLEAARTHAVGYVGQQAMQATAMVSQLEGQLGQLCPLAVARLQAIADVTAMTMVGVVMDAGRRLGQ